LSGIENGYGEFVVDCHGAAGWRVDCYIFDGSKLNL
jgi:hypothetical protein